MASRQSAARHFGLSRCAPRSLRDFLTNVAFTIRQGRQEQRRGGAGGHPTRLRVQPSAEMVVNKADRADQADRDDYFVLIFL